MKFYDAAIYGMGYIRSAGSEALEEAESGLGVGLVRDKELGIGRNFRIAPGGIADPVGTISHTTIDAFPSQADQSSGIGPGREGGNR